MGSHFMDTLYILRKRPKGLQGQGHARLLRTILRLVGTKGKKKSTQNLLKRKFHIPCVNSLTRNLKGHRRVSRGYSHSRRIRREIENIKAERRPSPMIFLFAFPPDSEKAEEL